MSTSSTNMDWKERRRAPADQRPRTGAGRSGVGLGLGRKREHADPAAVLAVIAELHDAGDLREQRVVLTEADVQARQEPPAALPHEDRPAGHDVAVEPLDAEALRPAVAAVA